MAGKIRVMVVDDHAIVREGIKALLELQEDIAVVAEASSSIECLDGIERVIPDVILMDLKMPGIDGIEATRLVKEKYPQTKVILLTNYDDEEYVIESIKAGADGYVLKDVKKGDLLKIIRGVLQNCAFIDPTVTRKLFHSIQQSSSADETAAARPVLSQRELQILTHLVEGKSNKDIAHAVNLSPDTVKSHLKNIYQKLGVSSRSQAARTAIQGKLVCLSR
ncbi:response regulator transcription factor [uncultured Desulfosarcina sp.]|uniref:response regulator transcription factor n=1 Tax=uncultured Desulfosarcina sp. TaxID=218289 RepID=UPI0029C6E798|nr:response regulator transcription factor [uncultured Desulfosarcina sp.]